MYRKWQTPARLLVAAALVLLPHVDVLAQQAGHGIRRLAHRRDVSCDQPVLLVEGAGAAARAAHRTRDPALYRLGALRSLDDRDQLRGPRGERDLHALRPLRDPAALRLH